MNSLKTVMKALVPLFFIMATQVAYSATVVEFYNPDLDNYFITADPGEQTFVDGGTMGRWQRTGTTFPAGGDTQVCRFYGSPLGPNSHFYTADPQECSQLKSIYNPAAKSWKFESNDFSIYSVVNGACATGQTPVYRAYNNGFARGVDSNHRISTSLTDIQQVVSKGWSNEGIVMCSGAPVALIAGTTVAPLTIKVNLDGSATKSATISAADGGSIALTDATGNSYTLTVPPGALLSDQEIRMTAIKSAQGIPLTAGLIAGVQFEPEGLSFMAAATLTIAPVQASVNGLKVVGFAYDGQGEEFHLYPNTVSGGVQTLSITHFSANGVSAGTDGEIATQRSSRMPSSGEAQAAQFFNSDNSPDQNYDALVALGTQIASSAATAGSNDILLDFAFGQFVSWQSMAEGYKLTSRLTDTSRTIKTALVSALSNAIKRSYDTCVNLHDANQISKMMRWAVMVEIQLASTDQAVELNDLVGKCAHFELDFTSTFKATNADDQTITVTTATEVNLHMSPFNNAYLSFTGLRTLGYTDLNFGVDQFPECTTTYGEQDGMLEVVRLTININNVVKQKPLPRSALAVITHGSPRELMWISCPNKPVIPVSNVVWVTGWNSFHDLDRTKDGFYMHILETGTSPVYLTQQWIRPDTFDGVAYTENTTIKLIHKPL